MFFFKDKSGQTGMLDLEHSLDMCLVECFKQNDSSALIASKNDISYSQWILYLFVSKVHHLIRQLARVVYRIWETEDGEALPVNEKTFCQLENFPG